MKARRIAMFAGLLMGAASVLCSCTSQALANGTPYYFDVSTGTQTGFGSPSGTYNGGNIWTTNTSGGSGAVGYTSGVQLTFGYVSTDLANSTFTVNINGYSNIGGIAISSSSANVTLIGNNNPYLGGAQNWTVAAGSTLTDDCTWSAGGLNFNGAAVTLLGGGTINFDTILGYNSGAPITQNGPVVNLAPATAGDFASQNGGYVLTSGTLNFAGANAFSNLNTYGSGKLTINGGVIDNTYGSSGTLSNIGGGISVGGNFTFNGSNPLSFGTVPVTLSNNPTITVNSNMLTIGGAIGGSGQALTLAGSGTLVLSGNNTYSGATTINGGTLKFATPGSLYNSATASWTAANINVASGATLALNVGGPSDFTTANVTTLLTSLNGAVSNDGLQAGSSIGFDTTNATSGATLSNNIANTAGTGGGAVGLVKLGPNTLTLSGNNTYSGNTVVSGGVLLASTTAGLPGFATPGQIIVNSGAAVGGPIGGAGWTEAQIATLASAATFNAGSAVAIDTSNGNYTYNDSLPMTTQGLTVTGTNMLTLASSNAYSGATTVTAGTLNIAAGGSLTNPGNINAVSGGVLAISGTVNQAANSYFAVGSGLQGTTGTTNVNSGAVVNLGGNAVLIGGATNNGQYGIGVLNINGGIVNVGAASGNGGNTSNAAIWINPYLASGGSGSALNLNGGTLSTARSIQDGGSGQSVVSFNGGVLQAAANINLAPYSVTLGASGGTINTQSYTVTQGAGANSNASAISGPGGLTVAGNGTLLLTTTNSYTGTTTISGGTLQIGNGTTDGSIATSSGIIDNAALVYNLLGGQSYTNGISGSGSVAMTGPGTLTLGGINSYGGGTTIGNGVMVFTSTAATPAGTQNITINNPGALAISGAYTTATGWLTSNLINPASTGALALTGSSNENINFAGFPSLSLGALGTQTYMGTITPAGSTYYLGSEGGTLVLPASPALTDGSTPQNVVINGNVTLAGNNTYSGTTTITAGTLQVGSGGNTGTLGSTSNIVDNGTLAFSRSDSVLALSQVISGSGGVIQNGSGMVTLAGNNSFSGNTLISSGTLSLGSPLALQYSTLNTSGAGLLSFGTLTSATVGGLTGSGSLALTNGTAGVALSVGSNGFSNTYSGAMSGNGSLIKIGPGMQTLSGASITYTGSTNVSAGMLTLLNATSFNSSITDNATTVLSLNSGGWRMGAITISGSGTLIKSGAQSITLGANGTTYMAMTGGLIDIQGGTITNTNFAGNWSNNKASMEIDSGGDLDLTGNSIWVDALTGVGSVSNFYVDGETLTVGVNGGSGTFSGTIINGGGIALVKNGGGTETLTSAASTWNNGTTVNAGVLQLASGASLGATTGAITSTGGTLDLGGNNLGVSGAVTFQGGTVQDGTITNTGSAYAGQSGTVTATLAGAVALNKTTAGVLTLTATNTYAGGTNITAGALDIQSLSAMGTGTVTVNGGQLIVDELSGTLANNLNLSGNASGTYGNGALVLHNDGQTLNLSGSVTLTGSAQIRSYSAGGTTIFNNPIGGSGNLTFDAGGAAVTHNQYYILQGGPSTYSGNTTIAGDSAANSIVQLQGGSLPSATVLTLQDGNAGGVLTDAVLDLAGSNQTVAGLSNGTLVGQGVFVVNSSASVATLTINGTGSSAYSGVIGLNATSGTTGQTAGSGNIALVKSGTGTQTLSGSNTYSGGTTINAGVLKVGSNSALGSAAVSLAGGTLSLAGISAGGGASIGINFVGSGGSVTGSDGPTGAVMSNWNNLPGSSPSGSSLINSSSATTTASINTSGGNSGAASSGSTDALLNGYIYKASGTITVNVSGIPYANYSLYAFSEDSTPGHDDALTLSGSTFYFSADNANTFDVVTNTSSAIYPTGNYVVANGLTGGSQAVSIYSAQYTGFSGFEIVNTTYTPTTLANAVNLTSNSTIDVTGASTGGDTGQLTIGGNTLSITGGGSGANTPYSLTLGSVGGVTLTGNPTFNVANNGSGAGTLILGALNDSGSASTITIRNSGAVTLSAAASAMNAGDTVNVTSGTLNSNNATALGTLTAVNVASGATFTIGASQTVGALGDNGTVAVNGASVLLNGNALTVGSGNNLSSTFSGEIADGAGGPGSLVKAGTGTFELSGSSTFTGGTTVTAGTLQLGDGVVNNGSLQGNVADKGALVFANPSAQTFSGQITGGGSLTKTAAGTLVLGGSNSYTGGTSIQSGLLVVSGYDNALPEGPLSVTGGSLDLHGNGPTVTTLSGSGTIGNGDSGPSNGSLLTVTAGGTYSGVIQDGGFGGDSPTGLTLTGGELILSGSNSFTGGTTVSNGTLILENSEALAGGSSLTVGDASAFAPLQAASASIDSASAALAINPVPEPGTLLLVAAGAAMGIGIRYRKRRK